MGFLNGLFANEPKSTTATASMPDWMTNAGQDLWKQASGTQKAFEGFGANPFASTSDATKTATGGFGDQYDWMTTGAGKSMLDNLFSRGPQSVSTQGTFDAGDIDKYMNPYVDKALQPALAQITKAADAARNRAKAGATAAGAFGDARHGIVDNGINLNEGQAIGDTASKFYMDAFNQAVGTKQADINRQIGADTTNAGFNQQDFQDKAGLLGQQNSMQSQILQQLFGVGQDADDRAAKSGTFDYNEFIRGQGSDQSQLGFLQQMLSSLASSQDRTTTSTEKGGAGPGWALLGGALSGLAGNAKI
jgi:hypothetical protein